MNVYTVRDQKAEAYLRPFFCKTNGEALRAIMDVLGDRNHQFTKYPEDFAVFRIGEFNEETGMLIPLQQIEFMWNIIDIQIPSMSED